MIDIRFDPAQIANVIEKAAYEAVSKEIQRRVGTLRDPETGRPPKITKKGRDLKTLSFVVEGSEAMIEQLKRKLG